MIMRFGLNRYCMVALHVHRLLPMCMLSTSTERAELMQTMLQILWTRITPRVAYNVSDTIAETSADYQVEKPADVAYEVNWSVSRNNDMSNPEAKGTFKTTYDRDWTVKVTFPFSAVAVTVSNTAF